MALRPGTRIGLYEIQSALGAGGMGEVYRARDTRLDRPVAIKILPASFAHDPERLARFEREAKTLASLNHPNIAIVHGFEEADGIQALVMELVDGPTLAERIAHGPIPFDESLPIARQIAEGLEAAHEHGIVHRDLKPANIKITPAGLVKVLDFGLAKGLDQFPSHRTMAEGPETSPTITSPAMTQRGMILGTAAYMSPEQARGQPVDKRADIWAFGCVLFEMLTGRPAFGGDEVTDVMTAVIRDEPAWKLLPADVPELVRALLRACLAKDRRARASDIGVARFVLDRPAVAPPITRASSAGSASPLRWAVLGFAVASAGAALMLVFSPRSTAAPRPVYVTLPIDEPAPFAANAGGDLAISPDGTRVVFSAQPPGGVRQLFARTLNDFSVTPLAGSENAYGPAFSPDGEWIVFQASPAVIRKVSVSGGAPVTVLRRTTGGATRGASWGADGQIYFSEIAGISRVPASGGAAEMLVPSKGRQLHWPQVLPGANAIVFSEWSDFSNTRVTAFDLRTRTEHPLVEGATAPRFVPTGHLLYAIADGLMAAPFDPHQLRITGAAVPVIQGVSGDAGTGNVKYDIANNGTLVFVPGGLQANTFAGQGSLVWMDRKGSEQVVARSGQYVSATLAPDGKKAALQLQGSTTGEVWIYDLDREARNLLTFDGNNQFPIWTPDGKYITYQSAKRDGTANVYRKAADGSGAEERLTFDAGRRQLPNSWSPDGRILVMETQGGGLQYLTMEPQPAVHPLLDSPWNKDTPRLSPNGNWLAYASEETGTLQVYVQPFPSLAGKWQISTDGGTAPRWRNDGKELFYLNAGRLMSVTIQTTPSFTASKPALLFQGLFPAGSYSTYDVTADGQRFLMIKNGDQPIATHLNLILNWFEVVKALVPR